MNRSTWLAVVLATVVAGCTALRPTDEVRDGSVPSEAGPVDAGAGDAGREDAGPADASPADASASDGGPGGDDAGEPDLDAGEPDLDAGEPGLDAGEPGGDAAATDAGAGCPAPASGRRLVEVSGTLPVGVTRWTCSNLYRLLDVVFVPAGATLVIDPGVVVQANPISGLVVGQGGTMNANGTADAPIVFRPSAGGIAEGSWGGVALLGSAPIAGSGTETLRGVPTDGGRINPTYGGSTPTDSCGELEYVRIEFAGGKLDAALSEVAGLTFAGCGSDTVVDHVQVHRSGDDGVRVNGGEVGLRHVLVTGALDAGLRWHDGWVGTVQFLIVQSHTGNVTDIALEGSNRSSDEHAEPRSRPTIYNATLVGDPSSGAGVFLETGSLAQIFNALMIDFSPMIDLVTTTTPLPTVPGDLTLASSVLASTDAAFEDESGAGADDDLGFDEQAAFELLNTFTTGHNLADPTSESSPSFVPTVAPPTGATPPAPFDTSATYVGALSDTGPDWTAGWTDYPGS